MNTIVFPSNRGPLLPEAVPAELDQANLSKPTSEPQQFDILQSPFHDLGSDELLEELWEEGVNRQFKSPYRPKNRGNYVKSYVLSNLRIQAKLARLKVEWNLEALWDILPIELVILVFEFLHPIDLYHAIRSTKALRNFLLNKNSTTIWKESFLNHPDIPFYPPDVSAPKWASLIFGPATCDTCGCENSLVDYTLHLRRCDVCIDCFYIDDDEELVNAIQPIIGEFHDQLDNIWSIVKKVYHLSSFRYVAEEDYDEHEPRYSLKEVTERANEMRKYLLDIRHGALEAQTNYQTFLSVAGAATQECMEQAKSCQSWAHDIYIRSEAAYVASVPVFCMKSKKILLKSGHDSRDVETAQETFKSLMTKSSYANLSDPVLSRSKFWKYLPQLNSLVVDCRRYRLADELARRISTREGIINAFYWKTIRISFATEKMRYLLHPERFYNLRFFADYIHDPKESIDELDVFSARQEILSFTDTYIATKKRRLFKTLLNTGLLPTEGTKDSNPDDFLGLAIAVFECCHPSVFVGWEDAGIHFSCLHTALSPSNMDSATFIYFSDIGHQALKNLAELLHLDLRSALAKDLDTLNRRFVCKTCNFHQQAGLQGHYTMTWRECLTHAQRMRSVSWEYPHEIAFDVLSEVLTTSILALEQPFPPPADPRWTCKHCYTYSEPVKRAEVVVHAKTVHAITKPIQGVDFVYCHTESSPKRSPLFVGLDEHSNHRCLRCPSPKGLRLWKKTPDLFRHILDKHAIQSMDLVEGVDWVKVEAVEDDSWIEEKMRAERFILA